MRTLATRLGSRAEAEDVIQSALLQALDRAGDLRDRSKVVPSRPGVWRHCPKTGPDAPNACRAAPRLKVDNDAEPPMIPAS